MVRGRWKTKMGIIRTEGKAAIIAYRHALRAVGGQLQRHLVLSDNLSLVLAMVKGRGHTVAVNQTCRECLALSALSGASLHLRWIASEQNSADAPSRARIDLAGRKGKRAAGDNAEERLIEHGSPLAAAGGGSAACRATRGRGLAPCRESWHSSAEARAGPAPNGTPDGTAGSGCDDQPARSCPAPPSAGTTAARRTCAPVTGVRRPASLSERNLARPQQAAAQRTATQRQASRCGPAGLDFLEQTRPSQARSRGTRGPSAPSGSGEPATVGPPRTKRASTRR